MLLELMELVELDILELEVELEVELELLVEEVVLLELVDPTNPTPTWFCVV
ncbi:hypothetical protein G15_0632 [Enterococcus avium]|nr:hypothetical protein G15_0632 [Enterococcus avium]